MAMQKTLRSTDALTQSTELTTHALTLSTELTKLWLHGCSSRCHCGATLPCNCPKRLGYGLPGMHETRPGCCCCIAQTSKKSCACGPMQKNQCACEYHKKCKQAASGNQLYVNIINLFTYRAHRPVVKWPPASAAPPSTHCMVARWTAGRSETAGASRRRRACSVCKSSRTCPPRRRSTPSRKWLPARPARFGLSTAPGMHALAWRPRTPAQPAHATPRSCRQHVSGALCRHMRPVFVCRRMSPVVLCGHT